ncbi:MAG: transcriptional regulator [Mesorhizobium sp.]|nr:MAG: transcriptional regulator [Mesorhizobium sp.]
MAADEIIHQSVRLMIMAALNSLERREALEFTRLKAIVNATDGNLGAHIDTLAKAGYVVNAFSAGRGSGRCRPSSGRSPRRRIRHYRRSRQSPALPRSDTRWCGRGRRTG